MAFKDLHGVTQQIVEEVVRCLLKAGHALSVNDGEEMVLVKSTNTIEVLEALARTESDTIVAERDEVAGWVMLIYENGVDVISDYSSVLGDDLQPALEKADEVSTPRAQ